MQRRSSETAPNFDPQALLRLRTEYQLSHDALSAQVDIVRPDLIAYEKGRIRPGIDRVVALARAFDVDPWDLTTTDPERPTLAELRLRAGLSRTALAQQLGISRATWDAIEHGRRSLSPRIATGAAEILQHHTRQHLPLPSRDDLHLTPSDVHHARARGVPQT